MNTIVALSTAPLNCAIHVIRISGDQVYEIINRIIDRKIKKEDYKIELVNIMDGDKLIDNVLLMKFKAPKSFTGEDLVEINCHGGMFIAKKIIELVIKNGANYAKAGEFSQRALLNGKMDLINVESINNIINAKNDLSLTLAHNGLNNKLSSKLKKLNKKIFMLIGQIEVNIDYPEYDDVQVITNKKLIGELTVILKEINLLLELSTRVIKISEGIKVAIIGKPNVGKSSILNKILDEKKAIVSNVPGTTRDLVEGKANYKNFSFNFIDTAGIRDKANRIENFGIKKAREAYKKADIVLYVVDSKKSIDDFDKKEIKKLKNIPYILIYNKKDLVKNYQTDGINFSIKQDKIDIIMNAILEKIGAEDFLMSDLTLLQNNRQIGLLKNIIEVLKKILLNAKNNDSIDLLVEDLNQVHSKFNEILGQGQDIEFLDELFKNFCIGK